QKVASLRAKVLPRSDLEKTLAAIWSEALGIEQIGIHDSFFSLGGDSITSLGVISRARKQGFEISFQQMFSHPTIAGIIPLLKSAVATEVETYQAFSLVSANDQVKLPTLSEDAYPLTLLQAGLIFQSELQKGASWYHDIQVYTLNGTFNCTAFRRATQRMVEEHAILRTSYHLNEYDEFIQIVHRDMPLPLYIEDWSGIDVELQSQRLEQFIEQESHYQFDWQKPGLIRIHIQVLSEQNFRYILSFHDSTLDGWSINLLHTKLLRYYHLACQGEIPTVDFTDNFLRKYVTIERMTRLDPAAQQYWRDALLGYEPMPLPRLRSKSSDIPHIEYHDVEITSELSDRIRLLASKLGVPVKSVLLSAHLRVLSVLSNTQQVVTGYEHSGRPEEENVDQAIGLFLNSIPFMTCLAQNESWAQLIGRVHRQEAEFLPYRRFPMADMKVQLQTTETLFETVFNFTHFHMLKKLRALPGMNALDVRVRAETEFVLRAEFSQNAYTDQVEFSLHYHSNEFDASHIQRIGEYYRNVLVAIAADSEQCYSSIELISKAEKAYLDQIGRGAQRVLPELSAVHGIFEQAKRYPEKIALKDVHESVSYAALVQHVRATSNLLPVRTETQVIVALAIPRSVAWITAMLGVMAAGAVYMPLDPESPDARIIDLLEEGKVSHLICDIQQQARFVELVNRHKLAISIHCHNSNVSGAQILSLPSMSDLAYVLFTSGSTGKPKGALLEHQGMLNHMLAKIEDLEMHAGDILAQTAPVTFDVSVWQALTGLLCGAQTIVYAKDLQLDPGVFCARLKQDQVSILEIVPSYFALLLEYLEQQPTHLGALHTLIQTGEALKHELVTRWFALYPHIKLVNAYGPTEASDDITHHIFTAPPHEPIVPIGKPVQNMRIHILNSQDQLVPFGTPGEICVSGIGVGRGYINAPDKTEAAFDFDHPLAAWSIGRLYRTGDIGKWYADGSLAYMGRKDEQIKIRGMRIEIGEVENALLSIGNVLNAAVVLQERPEGARLMAFVQGKVDPTHVYEVAATLLPDFMLPEHILHCDQLPLNAAGKIDKKTLLQWCETQVKTSNRPLELPQSQLEQDLAQQWAGILRLPLASIGRSSNFFALGGNSLLAMSAAMRSHGQYSIIDLFTQKSLAKLARHIMQASNTKLPILQPLTDSMEGVTLVCFSYAGGNAINFQEVADTLRGKVDIRVLAAEPPGNDPSRDDPLIDVTDMVQLCTQEIQQQGLDDVVVWGHCSGCGAASEFAAQASAAGIKVRQLVFSGKVLRPETILQEQIAQTQANSDEQTLQWLIDVSGLDLHWGHDKNLQARLARAYRNDAVGANLILSKIWQGTLRLPVSVPLLCILAADDPLTQGSEQLADNWRQLTHDVRVACIPEGGHYFMKTQAAAISDILREVLTVTQNT
ncbi:amino acid adenylation domain-containing protein, partial [Pseudomonas tremae]|nr:amino acid adenylation domain-containing protein [Pseudomonas tremae]